MLCKTIAAISTPPGEGGISIVRLSGPEAIAIADKIFVNPRGKTLSQAASHTITYGHIRNSAGDVTDEVLVSVMRAPHSYTTEDVVEINCHGGYISAGKVLGLLMEAGAALAGPGEFTKRAFLGGRIDLSQAESVIDIIHSKTNLTHTIAVNQLGGRLSREINAIRDTLIQLLSHIQVLIDYPEEGLAPLSDREFEALLTQALERVEKLLSTANRGRLMQSGIMTAIVGKPNVGKSSLLNLLSGEDRAIVTDIAGTTRDAIEEYIRLGDVPLRIADTAGIRATEDVIERIGMEKSRKYMDEAQLVFFLLDAAKPLDGDDRMIMAALREKAGRQIIVLVNKTDLGCALDLTEVEGVFPHVIPFSVRENTGLEALEATVKDLFDLGSLTQDNDNIITNLRHKEALTQAKGHLEQARAGLRSGAFHDLVAIDIENAAASLGEITGSTISQEVVEKIFHSFCVGK